MTDNVKHQTMTQKLKAKKRAGRPSGRRNKVSTKEAIERALSSGKELTEIKMIIEHYIENADEYGLTVKNVLDFLKADIDLYRWMTETISKMEANEKLKEKGEQTEALPEGQVGNVVAFSLTAEES